MTRTLELIKQLFKIVDELESVYKGRKFTLDGHLVGSIGEVWAAEKYNLELLTASYPGHDARDIEGKLWQIKITSRERIGLRTCPDNLLVLKLQKSGAIEEVYKGDGKVVWQLVGKMQKNGQASVSLKTLKSLQSSA